jgi:quercetin dioxygenase-like cupin family protein
METKFITLSEQPSISQYWGKMGFAGRLGKDTTMYWVEFTTLMPHLWHYHKNHELIMVVRGIMEQLVGPRAGQVESKQTLYPGDVVHLPAGQWHAARPLEDGTRVVLTVHGGDGLYRAFEADGRELVGPGE